MKRLSAGLIFGVMLLAFLTTGCPSNANIKAAGRVTYAAAREGVGEVNAEVVMGDLSVEDAAFINPLLSEIGDAGRKVADDPRDFNRLSAAERRQLVEDYIADVSERAMRLEQAGVLRIKSERGRKLFARITRDIDRGLRVARILEAALPQSTQ